MSARADILQSIRENLKASAPHDALEADHAPRHHTPLPVIGAAAPDADVDRVTRFERRLSAVGGQVTRARDLAAAQQIIEQLLAAAGAQRVVRSEASELAGLPGKSIMDLTRPELFACDAGLTTAQWGIAETGTLVLESAHERHRLASLVPPLHIALLRTSRICDTLGEALGRVQSTESSVVTFITGPSRTADIELTLVIGVHGPQALHVVLIEDGR